MIENHIQTRLRREYEYQSEALKNWLRIVYRDPDAAWERLQAHVARKGFLGLETKLRERPRTLGRLNGAMWFNFWKSTQYQVSEQRVGDLCTSLRRWETAYVQLEQIDARIAEALEANDQRADAFDAVLRDQRKSRNKDNEREQGGQER